MDKWQAQYKLWSSFGIPAFDASSVPDGDDAPDFPYITYQGVDGTFDAVIPVSVNVWTRNYSWSQANEISNDIYEAVKDGGIVVRYDQGVIWATAENPFSQNLGDPNDDLIRRKVLNILLHFA